MTRATPADGDASPPAAATDINSQAYWEQRFEQGWEADHGRQQTRFFCELALATLPVWLRRQIVERAFTLCDWGCALGDGTDALARGLCLPVVGIDFSPVAIAKAAASYPDLRFACEDWLSTPGGPDWDVVFSSNTLEHFAEPWAVLARLVGRARRHVVLLLPFREPEATRIDEHRVSFDPAGVPLCPVPGWCLADARVVDLGRSPFWSGQQVLLVYSASAELAAVGLTDADCLAGRLGEPGAAAAAEAAPVALQEALRQRDAHAAAIELLLRENRSLQAEAAALRTAQHQLVGSRSWRWTAPLRWLRGRL